MIRQDDTFYACESRCRAAQRRKRLRRSYMSEDTCFRGQPSIRGGPRNKQGIRYTEKNYLFPYFYEQPLVLLAVVPRGSLRDCPLSSHEEACFFLAGALRHFVFGVFSSETTRSGDLSRGRVSRRPKIPTVVFVSCMQPVACCRPQRHSLPYLYRPCSTLRRGFASSGAFLGHIVVPLWEGM